MYQVSNLGRVKSFKFGKEKLLKSRCDGRYYHVTLYKDNKPKMYKVHRLVAQTFIPNPLHLPEVNHKDENKLNNCVDNLEWCTQKYNVNYGTGLEKRVSTQYKPVMCVETSKKYKSATDAGKQIGIGYKHICDCCRGRRNTTGGYHWVYVAD